MEVVILAGGLGTRLRSVVSDIPKCMAPVSGEPFLKHVFRYLAGYDVSRVILSVGYLREHIFAWVESERHNWPFEIEFAVEKEPLGTGGGIALALTYAATRYVAVLNGDTLFNVDLSELYDRHVAMGGDVTLALKPMHDFDRYGTVRLGTSGRIEAFEEKRYCDKGLINGGVYIIDRHAGIFPEAEKFSFETAVLAPLCAEGRLRGIVSDSYFIDIGIPEDYARAGKELPEVLHGGIGSICVDQFSTILLDRDGTINRLRPGDYVKTWAEFEFLPGVLETLARWTAAGKDIYIITNQRGVGKGLMSPEDLRDVHARMCTAIGKAGGRIDGIYCCTALDKDDPRRKPQTGMFRELLSDHPSVRPQDCLMVGDSDSDMAFAAACGIRSIKL